MKKILVTTALPYANGPIHLGHLLEGVQADIWVRFQKSIGNECYFFCADDTHGTPIMLAARKENITPEELIERIHKEHYRDLTSFLIEYNNYYTTNSSENKFFSEKIYLSLKQKGNISERDVEQSYCEHDKMFLPDRFIKGSCPKCKSQDQYGDGCEVCGSNYSPKDLVDSKCALCGNKPVLKFSKHLFVKLNDFADELQKWLLDTNHIAESARNKVLEWFHAGLQEWDISRDAPYFGFKIPGEKDKYFYVWLDAPIGYMASSKNFFKENSIFDEFWSSTNTELVHFIGKDILYFHALFWVALLLGSGYRVPSRINVHGFMTVNGEKMSKSRGTFIKAETYMKHLDPEHFRFYMASKLNDSIEDLDLNFKEYESKVNSELIGNLVNIVSRVGTSIADKLDRKLGTLDEESAQKLKEVTSLKNSIKVHFEEKNYSKAIREIAKAGDLVNKYINDNAPWNLIKTDIEKTRNIVTFAMNASKVIAIYLLPVVPKISQKVFKLLNLPENTNYTNIDSILENCKINVYEHLSKRVDSKAIDAMIEESKEKKQESEKSKVLEQSGMIQITDLAKVELRVGLIKEATEVTGSDKLLNLKVDLGSKGIKNVFAGIKMAYKPSDLIGLKVVVVANLAPRKMKFGISEAMILASGQDANLSVFMPHKDANPGDLLK